MRALLAYIKGWKNIIRNKRLVLIWYLANFMLALLAALPIPEFLGNTVGHSLSLGRSVEDFDFIFINEMMNEYGDLIRSILSQSLWMILLFLLVAIFLLGGVLTVFKLDEDRFSINAFLKGCAKYFWRLLRLAIYFLIIHGVALVIFFGIFSSMCDGLNPFNMESEKQILDALTILVPIYIFVFTVISLIHDYAKIHVVHRSPRFLFKPFFEAFDLVFRNFGKFFFLYLLNILTFLACLGIYWLISSLPGVKTMIGVFLTFLIGQLFIIGRIIIKLVNLSSATYLYKWIQHRP